jgi:trimeric autotransporter adhesin
MKQRLRGLVSSLAVTTALGLLSLPSPSQAQVTGCEPAWLPTFGGEPGVDAAVYSFGVFDDGSGSGPALHVGGIFKSAGGVGNVNRVARWDGAAWSALGSGVSNPAITFPGVGNFAVFDDGSGDVLYVVGSFTSAGGIAVPGMARWDGTSWSPPVSPSPVAANALLVFDDGSGPALYAGGTLLGGPPAGGVARWDGSTWTLLGTGMTADILEPAFVSTLAAFDDGSGSGPKLHAGGAFTAAGGVPAKHIAKWNGSSWSALGSGVSGSLSPRVEALEVFDDGSGAGPALYAGGSFTTAGGLTANNLARWNGTSWSTLAGGVVNTGPGGSPFVRALSVFDDGSGAALYAGGLFTKAGSVPAERIAKWSGSGWSALGSGSAGPSFPHVVALKVHDDGSGSRLFVGGPFASAGGVAARNIATWSAAGWSAMPGGGLDGRATCVAEFDEGGGPLLFVGGEFTHAGSLPVNRIARWDGSSWSALGSGFDGPVEALAVHDDGGGGGPALYAAGGFETAGGIPADGVARWNGASWSGLPAGLSKNASCLIVFDDGGGPALYAGGYLDITHASVKKWTGSGWTELGNIMEAGFPAPAFTSPSVDALAVFDDGSGSGPALYAAGFFGRADGQITRSIARWDGASWSPLGSGLGGTPNGHWVRSLTVFDDGSGSGPELYAAGNFTLAGGAPCTGLAKWNGTTWSVVANGAAFNLAAVGTHDDGSGGGPALFASGQLSSPGGMLSIGRWNGAGWSPLGNGTAGSTGVLVSMSDESVVGSALIAGGSFASNGDSYIARWAGCPADPAPWTHLGYALKGVDGPPLLAGTGTLLAGAPGSIDLTQAASSSLTVLFISLASTPFAFKGGTLLALPAALALSLPTDPSGELSIPFAAWPAGLSGLQVSFQYAIQDSAAIQGVALSNALRADIP